MANKEIPLLTANDVELRVSRLFKDNTKCALLVYKDARVDMRVLDSVYGSLNWQRKHDIIDGQLFCTVSVWDEDKQQWISKQDVGVESRTEAEKGRASDSFKRACFNLGIGRELYAAPDIIIDLKSGEVNNYKGKVQLNSWIEFRVAKMTFDKNSGEFKEFTVVDQNGNIRFALNKSYHQEDNNGSKGDDGNDGNDVPPVKPNVVIKGGVTYVLSKNGNYYPITAYTREQLNDMTNRKEYAAAHDAARKLLAGMEL